MMTLTERKLKNDFSITICSILYQWYNAKKSSIWANFNCFSVLSETLTESLFALISDNNFLIGEVCKEYKKLINLIKS